MTDHPIPHPRILLGPGPSTAAPAALEAMSKPPVGYLDPDLFDTLTRIQRGLQYVFGSSHAFTIALTGTGMAGMESSLANLLRPGDTIVVACHGFFGMRMAELARRTGATVIRVDSPWGGPDDISQLEAACTRAGTLRAIACVHAETSTGVLQPLDPIARVARAHNALLIVDAVTSLGGMPVEVDRLGIDVAYSATQKCLGSPPGLAPITVSSAALASSAARAESNPNWYLDWNLLAKYWGADHQYHHTVPVCNLMALDASLKGIAAEGLQQRWLRHQHVADLLVRKMEDLGLTVLADRACRLPMLTVVSIPPSADEAIVRRRLLMDYGIEIGGGLGELKGKYWRVGTMGESATVENVELLAYALRTLLQS